MGTNLNSLCASFLIFNLILHSCLCHEVAGDVKGTEARRKDLEIIIGGGGYGPASSPQYQEYCPSGPSLETVCPPPLPPPSLPPPPPPRSRPPTAQLSLPTCGFESERIELAYNIIQKFRKGIAYDPQGITKTWEGYDVCLKYKGFVCDTRPDIKQKAVAGVDFNGFNFKGPIFSFQEFLGGLEDLAIFHANSNSFTYQFPKTLSKYQFLYELDLSNNKFSTGFPLEILKLKNLTFLDLRFNSFYGPIPSEIFNLDLNVLFLNNNQFTLSIPENLGSTPALYLTFANNKFTGPIPNSIGYAKNLLEVLFLRNSFTGCLPYEIGFLSNATVFDVSSNQLTGPIPHSFGCLANIVILNLTGNKFYGTVPEMVCKLLKLQKLSLANNYFTQVGPECRKLINKKVLDIRMNCIRDLPYQRSPNECRNFFSTPRNCPNPKSLTWIPCAKNGYSNINAQTSDQKSRAAAPSPRTYDALIPHRL